MRTLPRMTAVPRIQCALHQSEVEQKPVLDADMRGAVGGARCCKDDMFRWG